MYYLAINQMRPDADFRKIGEVIPLHIEWTMKMIADGRCVQAGKWGERGGMAIIKAEGKREAELLLSEDPLIKSGLVTFTVERFFPDVKIH